MKIDSAEQIFVMEAKLEQMAMDQRTQYQSIREEIEQEKQQASSVKEALSTQVGQVANLEDAMCTQFGDLGQKLTGVLNMMTPKVGDAVGQIKEVAREIVAEIGGTVEAVGEGMKMTLDESADKLGM